MLIVKGAHADINNTDAYPERALSAGFELACMYYALRDDWPLLQSNRRGCCSSALIR